MHITLMTRHGGQQLALRGGHGIKTMRHNRPVPIEQNSGQKIVHLAIGYDSEPRPQVTLGGSGLC